MRSSFAALLFFFLLTATAGGCSPEIPTEAKSKNARANDRAMLDRVRTGAAGYLLEALSKQKPYESCYTANQTPAEQQKCADRDDAARERGVADQQKLNADIAALIADTAILSFSMTATTDYPGNGWTHVALGPQPPEQKKGTRNAVVGVTIGTDEQLGWGLYQTRFRSMTSPANDRVFGDTTDRPGYELMMSEFIDPPPPPSATPYMRRRISMTVVVLTDGWKRPSHWM